MLKHLSIVVPDTEYSKSVFTVDLLSTEIPAISYVPEIPEEEAIVKLKKDLSTEFLNKEVNG